MTVFGISRDVQHEGILNATLFIFDHFFELYGLEVVITVMS